MVKVKRKRKKIKYKVKKRFKKSLRRSFNLQTAKRKIQSSKILKFLGLTAKIIIFLAFFISSVMLLRLFLFSDIFNISTINCQKEGNSCTNNDKFFINDFKNKNIFSFDKVKEKKQILHNFPEVRDVVIVKRLPGTLEVSIFLRKPIAILSANEKIWYLVDKEGYIYKRVDKKAANLPLVIFPNKSLVKPNYRINKVLNPVLETINALNENFVDIEKIFVNNNEFFTLFLADSYVQVSKNKKTWSEPIISSISAKKSPNEQVGSLQFILRQSKIEGKLPSTIDLRFNKPVVKY